MQRSPFIKRIVLIAGILAVLIFAVILMLFLRKRMQNKAGITITPAPATFVATPSPSGYADHSADTASSTPTPEPTPFVDPDIVQGKDRGLLVALVQARLYALGYFPYKPTGYFAVMTQNSVRAFQQANNLLIDGVVSGETLSSLFSNDAKYAATTSVPLPAPTPPAVRPRDYGEALLFSQVDTLMPVGSRFLVVDLNSQLYFNAVRMGGTNHMDIVPASDEDMQRYLAIFSGRSSFDKRACVVEYQDRIIAASLCGWLHGDVSGGAQTLCLYFFGCTANDSAMEDAEHNANLILSSNGVLPVGTASEQ